MSIGSSVSDIFGAIGDFQEAAGYGKAAGYATQEAGYAKLSGQIQEQQTQRQIYQTVGAQQAAEAGAGFSETGSAQDLLRSSVQQGTLQKSLVATQSMITQTGYEAQAAADRAMASAAQIAGTGQAIGAGLNLLGTAICTELMRQGRISKRLYIAGGRVSVAYPAAVLEGYHIWAVPSVRHLRKHPYSLYSRFLETIFIWYLGNIGHAARIPGAHKRWQGTLVTAIIYHACYVVGWARLMLDQVTDWEGLYRA